MRDWIDIGSSPPAEACAQLGSDGYWEEAKREGRAYIELLRRALGPEPVGANLSIRSNPHDFGSYLSVVCYFETESSEATDYALRCEAEGPEEWDDIAREELPRGKTRKENAS
jgi:hypothetical protein